MTTSCNNPILSTPLKFLGATVLSFNGSLGWGTQESSVTIDVIEDCEAGDNFIGDDLEIIGGPVNFPSIPYPAEWIAAGSPKFSFNGVVTNWTVQKGNNGKTYNIKLVDPRQLLENTMVIVDTYAGPPAAVTNYFNVYAFYEEGAFNGNCATFGDATNVGGNYTSIERGMPYTKVLEALMAMNPVICSPTGFKFNVNFSKLMTIAPPPLLARVSGPSVSMLQIVTDLCEMNGCDFYVTLTGAATNGILLGATINIEPIKLLNTGNIANNVLIQNDGRINLDSLTGQTFGTTEISYGRELRNDKVKTVIFGEKQHYMVEVNDFDYYFGEDEDGNPIIPIDNDDCGFTIRVNIRPLQASLLNPLNGGDKATLHELDLRAALASYDMWYSRALHKNEPAIAPVGSLNKFIQQTPPYDTMSRDFNDALNNINVLDQNRTQPDRMNNPVKEDVNAGKFKVAEELKAIHDFVANIASTYYGKQFLATLPGNICMRNDDEKFKEKLYSATPTNDGAWVEPPQKVLNLGAPQIEFFAQDDGRIGAFALFTKEGPKGSGNAPPPDGAKPSDPNSEWSESENPPEPPSGE
jgi:hypothetical protein